MAVVRLLRRVGSPFYRIPFVVALLLAGACMEGGHLSLQQPVAGNTASGESPHRAPVAESVLFDVERGVTAGALVLLDPSFVTSTGQASLARDRVQEIAEVQAAVLSTLPRSMLSDVRNYKYFPLMYAALNAPSLAALREHPAVVEVFENRAYFTSVGQSLAVIRQPEAVAAGQLGSGVSVAVLDTGTDYTQPIFGSCTAPGAEGCRVAVARDFAPEDSKLDESGHGTNVAGIVASVAPGARILGLDVFTGAGAYSNVILDAIEWVIANRAVYNVAAVNMSLGAGLFAGSCDSDVFAVAMYALRDAGILPVVASGNNGSIAAIASPACVSAALAVGAVYDANVGSRSYPAAGCSDLSTATDKVACFSNSSEQLAMLAPGASISAASLEMSGTSQAAPHVAGAAAVLAAAYPGATPAELTTRLTQTGPAIVDPRNGIARRRLDLAAAMALDLGGLGPIVSAPPEPTPPEPTPPEPAPTIDVSGPIATITLAEGAVVVTTRKVTLSIETQDGSDVVSMCVSNSLTCRTYVAYQPQITWTLSRGSGVRTVYVRLRDGLGNHSGPFTDTVLLDAVPPVNGAVSVVPGDGLVQLTMDGAHDLLSNDLSYVVVGGPGTAAPTSCKSSPELYSGSEPSAIITGLTNGVPLALRMCVKDGVGNLSTGVPVLTKPAPEFDPPSGSVLIDQGAAHTVTRTVSLSIDAEDESGVATMCISSGARCTRYVPYSPTATFTLAKSNGIKTVYVYLRDVWGNQTSPALTDTILYDSVAPTDGTVSVVAGDGIVEIAMAGAHDAFSSALTYLVVGLPGTVAPPACHSGTEYYRGSASFTTLRELTNGVQLALRMCVIDEYGNMSRGVVFQARPAPEFEPPSGSVVIAGGAAYTPSRSVTLSLDAQDPSGVAEMCISQRRRCENYVSYAESAPFTLATSTGVATVYAYFRDVWGNQLAVAATDTIIVDTAPPSITSLNVDQSASGSLGFSWSARDIGIGVAGFTLQYAPGGTAPSSCDAGTRLYSGEATAFAHTGLPAGKHGYRLCVSDQLGNTSSRAYIGTVQ